MPTIPSSVAEFLASRRIAVAGVSRTQGVGNAVLRKLRDAGHEVVPINPHATELEGSLCYPDLKSVPGELDALVFASHPRYAADLVRQAAERGVRRIWFHRSFGEGSVADAAVRECRQRGIEAIVGGCPLMYCEPVDLFHRCLCWWLRRSGRVPA
ncbi:MAG: CoA-binding protein [Thermoanaerobaculia bacterium]